MLFILLGILGLVGAAILIPAFISAYKSSHSPSMTEIGDMFKLAKEAANAPPEPRSVSAATPIYLPKIEKDFAGYHFQEAVNSVKTVLHEYLAIRYEGAEKFEKSNVSDQLIATIERQAGHTVEGEQVHKVGIAGYTKTRNYATITYQAAVGFTLDGNPVEGRYNVDATFRLIENDIAQKSLICPHCGGTYDSAKDTICPFCGSDIVRDTFMSWQITSVTEC